LPYPTLKIVIFPAESIVTYGWVAGYVERYGDYKRSRSIFKSQATTGACPEGVSDILLFVARCLSRYGCKTGINVANNVAVSFVFFGPVQCHLGLGSTNVS